MIAMLDRKPLTGRDVAQFGNIARDCERANERSSFYIGEAANWLCQLGLLSDSDRRQFLRYYEQCALVDAAKLLAPPGWNLNLYQNHEKKWCACLTQDDPVSGWFIEATRSEGTAITEPHARTAAAMRAWRHLVA